MIYVDVHSFQAYFSTVHNGIIPSAPKTELLYKLRNIWGSVV